MTTIVGRVPINRARSWPLRWVAVLLVGLGLFGAVLAMLVSTGDPIYVPCLLLVGAAVAPATLTTFVSEVEPGHRLSLARVITAAIFGGVAGGVLAGQLEADTIRTFGSLPYLLIGLIEEAVKLAIPIILFTWRRPRPRAVEGLVLGVAVGSGFAAVETMGYAFVALLRSGGHLQPVDNLLLLRGMDSLGGHAAWTGLACAAWFAIRGSRHRLLAWLRFLGTFIAVATLHAQWDATAASHGEMVVGAVSFGLLAGVAWWLHRHQVTIGDVSTAMTLGSRGSAREDDVELQLAGKVLVLTVERSRKSTGEGLVLVHGGHPQTPGPTVGGRIELSHQAVSVEDR